MKNLHFTETKPIDVQDREEACIRRICKYFNWTFDVAPNPLASDYESIKFRLREYIALSDRRTVIRCLSPYRGESISTYLVFEDFLEWLNVVEWFSSNDWFLHLNDGGYSPWTIKNHFFGQGLKTIETVHIFLDLI